MIFKYKIFAQDSVKTKYRVLLGIYLLFLMNLQLSGQDVRKDMDRMREFYLNSNCLSSQITVKIYRGSETNLFAVKNSKIIKEQNDFYYELDESKMIISPSSMLLINEVEKDIVFRAVSKKEYEAYLEKQFTYSLDSIIRTYDSLLYLGISGGNKHYRMHKATAMISTVDFYINASTNALSKITYHYNKNLMKDYYKVDIFFDTTQKKEMFYKKEHYITQASKVYHLTPAYNHYHLILAQYED